MRSHLFVLAAAAVVAATTAGCTGDGVTDPTPTPSRSPAATVPVLKSTWTQASGPRFSSGLIDNSPRVFATSTAVVVPGTQSLTAYGSASGARQWALNLPKPICATSDAPNDDGVVALLLGSSEQEGQNTCAVGVAVDLDTGKILWTKSVASSMSDVGVDDVQIGPAAVAFTNTCNAAVTLSVRDGSVLSRFPKDRSASGSCGDSFASDGTVVVDGREANARGGADALVGYDAATGRRQWSVPVRGTAAYRSPNIRLFGVVSADPPVIDADVNGHRLLRTIDTRAGRATPFGRQFSSSFPVFVHRNSAGSDVLDVQYPGSPVLFGFDVRSGAQLRRTVLDPGETAVGTRGADVITQAYVTRGAAGVAAGRRVVRAVDAGGVRRIVGQYSNAAASALGVVGGTLIVGTNDQVTGVRLPNRSLDVSDLATGVRWAPGDLTPRAVVELCQGITTATERALGFVEPDLPIPAGCRYVESLANDGILQIYTSVFAVEPTARATAAQQARRTAAGFLGPDKTNGYPAATPVTGIGDQAGIVVSKTGKFVRLTVRRSNVVVVIDLSEDDVGSSAGVRGRLVRGIRLVAHDLVAEVDRRA